MSTTVDLAAIESAVKHYLSPEGPSVLECCRTFGVSEGTLRRVLKARGIVARSAVEQKRKKVVEHFAGGPGADRLADAEPTAEAILAAAEVDIGDMQSGLEVARGCLRRLKELVPKAADAREIKLIAEANEKAVLTIRKIRGLDAPVDFSDWSDDELEQFARTGRMPSGRR
ncbi:hypothetical protein JCM19379_29490 [Methyloparacoccus murrellii]